MRVWINPWGPLPFLPSPALSILPLNMNMNMNMMYGRGKQNVGVNFMSLA